MPSNESPIRVLIAHANPLVAVGLEAVFGAREDLLVVRCVPDEVLEASTRDIRPDVAVTDLPAGLRILRRGGSACRVLIVTDDDSEVSIRKAAELGVRGYLPLTSCGEVVERAVRTIHRGGKALDPLAMTKIALSLASPTLTGKEMEVLGLMMNGLTNKEIARTLKQSVGTAKGHVKSILSKLDVGSRAEAIVVARRRGLVADEGAGDFLGYASQGAKSFSLQQRYEPLCVAE